MLLGVAVACSALIVAFGPSGRVLGVVAPIAGVLALGARRHFAARPRPVRRHGRAWVGGWLLAIAALVGFEVWQLARGRTTATALVVPLIATPALRAAALAVWLRLGWELSV